MSDDLELKEIEIHTADANDGDMKLNRNRAGNGDDDSEFDNSDDDASDESENDDDDSNFDNSDDNDGGDDDKGVDAAVDDDDDDAAAAAAAAADDAEDDDLDDDDEKEEEKEEEEEEDIDDMSKFKKFNQALRNNYVTVMHPESMSHNDDEIHSLAHVVRDQLGAIIDPLHRTIPILTKYEKTRILGVRTKQINEGAPPYVSVKSTIIDGYIIAMRELEEKKIPFIVRRPLPNGGSEYWYLQDLEII
jgi:DNA-directed RNA polymerase subunit K/omega